MSVLVLVWLNKNKTKQKKITVQNNPQYKTKHPTENGVKIFCSSQALLVFQKVFWLCIFSQIQRNFSQQACIEWMTLINRWRRHWFVQLTSWVECGKVVCKMPLSRTKNKAHAQPQCLNSGSNSLFITPQDYLTHKYCFRIALDGVRMKTKQSVQQQLRSQMAHVRWNISWLDRAK